MRSREAAYRSHEAALKAQLQQKIKEFNGFQGKLANFIKGVLQKLKHQETYLK